MIMIKHLDNYPAGMMNPPGVVKPMAADVMFTSDLAMIGDDVVKLLRACEVEV